VYGYEAGKIYNIVGDSSTGKTFLAVESIAHNIKKHGKKLKFNYDDCEEGCTLDSDKLFGFDVVTEKTLRSHTVEDLFCNITNFVGKLKDDEFGMYIVDSLDALNSEQGVERAEKRVSLMKKGKTLDAGSYNMEKQKFLSNEFFKELVTKLVDKDCCLIIISQVRENIGVMFGEKYTRAGGKALDFYAHSCIWLAVVEKIKKKDRTVGATIKLKTKKSKTPRPARECYVTFYFDYGIDNVIGNIDFLYDLRTPKGEVKKDTTIEWDGHEMTRHELVTYIESNGLEDELAKRTVEKWEDIENQIKTERKAKF
jgi:RecA/RadA recombinase